MRFLVALLFMFMLSLSPAVAIEIWSKPTETEAYQIINQEGSFRDLCKAGELQFASKSNEYVNIVTKSGYSAPPSHNTYVVNYMVKPYSVTTTRSLYNGSASIVWIETVLENFSCDIIVKESFNADGLLQRVFKPVFVRVKLDSFADMSLYEQERSETRKKILKLIEDMGPLNINGFVSIDLKWHDDVKHKHAERTVQNVIEITVTIHPISINSIPVK